MAYTFDGINKLIILSSGTTTVDAKDMYSRWKEWVLVDDNTKYLHAFSALGGDPLPGGRYLGTTYFVENGWKIRPYEGNHTLVLSGNLYARDGSDPFVNTLGSFNVRIMVTVSNLVDTVTTGGGVGTVDEVRDAVWSDTNFASHGPTAAGTKLNSAGNAGDPWASDLSSYPSGTAGHDLYTKPNAAAIADQVRTELTPELTAIMALQNGLTEAQAIMLTEIYRMHGLDPTKPLIVTKTARTAGVAIQQQISGDSNITTVTRI
jgi:hypothetical protein